MLYALQTAFGLSHTVTNTSAFKSTDRHVRVDGRNACGAKARTPLADPEQGPEPLTITPISCVLNNRTLIFSLDSCFSYLFINIFNCICF